MLDILVKVSASLQAVGPKGPIPVSGLNTPDPVSATLKARARVLDNILTLAAGASKTLDLVDLGITTPALLYLVCMTPGLPFALATNGAVTATLYTPFDSSQKAFHLGSTGFTSLVISNPDLTLPISVSLSILEKAP